MMAAGAAFLWLASVCGLLTFVYRRAFGAAWSEPVLRSPVLILESDDWGYGPIYQAQRLDQIGDLLEHFRDSYGSAPVMTLGVVLGGPDTLRISADGGSAYHRLTLAHSALAPVRDAMLRGAARGVFSLQLHGMEHYWPPSLMSAAKADDSVRRWITQSGFPESEDLPTALQSRWIDAATLPSRPLSTTEAEAAAAEEVQTFASIFGFVPQVVVPATFVWNDTVEQAWVRSGVRVVVTPGVRNESRDAAGRVMPGKRMYFTAETGPLGARYVVRDCYLEPFLGQTHQRALQALEVKTRAGRPTLIEIHRLNFIRDDRTVQHSLGEVRLLLERARALFPNLRFMSTEELARHCREHSELVERRLGIRLHFLIRRLAGVSRLRKLALATGAALPALVAYMLTRPRDFARASS